MVKINSGDLLSPEQRDRLKSYVQQVNWNTAHKLFTEVFSNQSRYMTVHQAKGLEWNKVIVSLIPNRFDETSIDKFYASPCVMRETSADEFARMYYVACSRAKEQLFIHIPQKNGDFQAEIIRNLSSLISTSQLKFII